MYTRYPYPDELYHYGVRGMKWGIVNEDPRDLITKLKKKRRAQLLAKKVKETGSAIRSTIKTRDTRYKGPSNIPSNQRTKSSNPYKGPTSISSEQQKARSKDLLKEDKKLHEDNEFKRSLIKEKESSAQANYAANRLTENNKRAEKEAVNQAWDRMQQRKAQESATKERDERQKKAEADKKVESLKKSVSEYLKSMNQKAAAERATTVPEFAKNNKASSAANMLKQSPKNSDNKAKNLVDQIKKKKKK